MKIVVTGSAGFIGYHLTKSLLKDGYEVLGIDNINNYYDQKLKIARIELLKSYKNFIFHQIDIANLVNLTKSFNFFHPNKVVNLAAQPGVRNSHISSDNYVHSNLLGFVNLIELSDELSSWLNDSTISIFSFICIDFFSGTGLFTTRGISINSIPR